MLPAVPAPAIPFDADREAAELRAYLGDAYDQARLERYEQQLEEELARWATSRPSTGPRRATSTT